MCDVLLLTTLPSVQSAPPRRRPEGTARPKSRASSASSGASTASSRRSTSEVRCLCASALGATGLLTNPRPTAARTARHVEAEPAPRLL